MIHNICRGYLLIKKQVFTKKGLKSDFKVALNFLLAGLKSELVLENLKKKSFIDDP